MKLVKAAEFYSNRINDLMEKNKILERENKSIKNDLELCKQALGTKVRLQLEEQYGLPIEMKSTEIKINRG